MGSKEELPVVAGFRTGDRGTHTSRTIMLAELTTLLGDVPQGSTTRRLREGNRRGQRAGKEDGIHP